MCCNNALPLPRSVPGPGRHVTGCSARYAALRGTTPCSPPRRSRAPRCRRSPLPARGQGVGLGARASALHRHRRRRNSTAWSARGGSGLGHLRAQRVGPQRLSVVVMTRSTRCEQLDCAPVAQDSHYEVRPQQRLYFLPLLHGHGALRPSGRVCGISVFATKAVAPLSRTLNRFTRGWP
jgi:hypothetical protein